MKTPLCPVCESSECMYGPTHDDYRWSCVECGWVQAGDPFDPEDDDLTYDDEEEE